jgi:DNA-binding MarR family transcriptional regulator
MTGEAGPAPPPADGAAVPIEQVMGVFLRKPGFLLNRIDQIANMLYAAEAAAGETLAQAEMLLAIAATEGCGQVGLARACGIDTSTTAIILDNLEAGGLIARQRDARDRRRTLPCLTQAGRDRMPAVRSASAALQQALLTPLTPEQRSELHGLLDGIARAGAEAAPRWDMACSPFAGEPSLLFRRALQISHGHFAACVAPSTITLRQFSALMILRLHPGLSQVAFARVYGLDPSTCAVVLKKLAARGLLAPKRPAEDRRKTLYFTTEEGARQAAALQSSAEHSAELMLGRTGPRARARLVAMLQAIVRAHSHRLRYPGCLPWDVAAADSMVD